MAHLGWQPHPGVTCGRALCSLSPKPLQWLRRGKNILHRDQALFFQKRPQQPGAGDCPSPFWGCGGLENSFGQGSVGRRVLSLWGMRFGNCREQCEGWQGETWGCQNRGKVESQGSTEGGCEGGSSSCRGELLHFSSLLNLFPLLPTARLWVKEVLQGAFQTGRWSESQAGTA